MVLNPSVFLMVLYSPRIHLLLKRPRRYGLQISVRTLNIGGLGRSGSFGGRNAYLRVLEVVLLLGSIVLYVGLFVFHLGAL